MPAMTERLDPPHVGINDPRWDDIFALFCDLFRHHPVRDVVRILEEEHDFKTT